MNKKEFLKSINNLDDRFLREGEEFFAPVEAEKNPSVYKKKGISLKPVISAAACCAAVAAVVVFMGGLNNNMSVMPGSVNSENTEATEGTETAENAETAEGTEAAENTVEGSDITADSNYQEEIEAAISSAAEAMTEEGGSEGDKDNECLSIADILISVSGVEVKGDGIINVTQPQEINVKLNLSAKGAGEPKPVRFFVLKDGAPISFSNGDKDNLRFNDVLFAPNSNIEVPISFKVDQEDRCISIVGMIDPLSAEAEGTGVFSKCFINSACKTSPSHEMNVGNQSLTIEGYPLDEYGEDELSDCKIDFEQDDEGGKFNFHLSYGVNQLKYITIFINGEPAPVFGYPNDGQSYDSKITARIGYSGAAEVKCTTAIIKNVFIKPGDVVQAVLSDANAGMFYSSDRNIIK